LEIGGQRAQQIKDAFLTNWIGVDQDVVEDEDLRFVGYEFLRNGEAEAEKELFFGALGELVECMGFFAGAADAGDLQVFVEEDLTGGVASEFSEGGGEAVFQGGQYGLGRGLFAVFDKVVGDAGAPCLAASGVPTKDGLGISFLQFCFPGVKALPAERLQNGSGLVAVGPARLQFVGDLLKGGSGPFVALGKFFEVRWQFLFGADDAGLGLGEGKLGGCFCRVDALGISGIEVFNLGFKHAETRFLFPGAFGRFLNLLDGGAFLGAKLGELLGELGE